MLRRFKPNTGWFSFEYTRVIVPMEFDRLQLYDHRRILPSFSLAQPKFTNMVDSFRRIMQI